MNLHPVKRCYNTVEARDYLGLDLNFFIRHVSPNLPWIAVEDKKVVEVVELDKWWDAYVARQKANS